MAKPGYQSGGCGKVAMGCGIAFLIVVIIGGVAGWYIAKNLKKWSAHGVAKLLEAGVKEMKLPADKEQRLLDKVDYIKNEFIAGNITVEQLAEIADRLNEGLFFQASMIRYVESHYVIPSGLTIEEKAHARLTLERVLRGVFVDETISEQDIDAITAPITIKQPDGSSKFKDPVTDNELRAFLALAKEKADVAGVPLERYEIDLATEFETAVDEVVADH